MRIFDKANWEQKIFNGDWISGSGGDNKVYEPATGNVLTITGTATAEDVNAAARQAATAQVQWMKKPPRERAAIFLKAADFLQQNLSEIGLYIARETGGIIPKGEHEVRESIMILQLAAGLVMQPNGLTLPTTSDRQSYA